MLNYNIIEKNNRKSASTIKIKCKCVQVNGIYVHSAFLLCDSSSSGKLGIQDNSFQISSLFPSILSTFLSHASQKKINTQLNDLHGIRKSKFHGFTQCGDIQLPVFLSKVDYFRASTATIPTLHFCTKTLKYCRNALISYWTFMTLLLRSWICFGVSDIF